MVVSLPWVCPVEKYDDAAARNVRRHTGLTVRPTVSSN